MFRNKRSKHIHIPFNLMRNTGEFLGVNALLFMPHCDAAPNSISFCAKLFAKLLLQPTFVCFCERKKNYHQIYLFYTNLLNKNKCSATRVASVGSGGMNIRSVVTIAVAPLEQSVQVCRGYFAPKNRQCVC